jgi:hypothetical protein
MKSSLTLLLFLVVFSMEVISQPVSQAQADLPDPKSAFLRSLAVPGWGHHYIDRSNWVRGQFHLAGDAALILSYLGLSVHSNNLQQNWYSYGAVRAGVPIKGRSREFQLAVGDFNSLEAYNDYQERSRNWDRLFADTPQNRWQWQDDAERSKYNNMRSSFERIDQQLPALLALMAVNRIVSGISAYNRARKVNEAASQTTLSFLPFNRGEGFVARLQIGL